MSSEDARFLNILFLTIATSSLFFGFLTHNIFFFFFNMAANIISISYCVYAIYLERQGR